MDSQELQDIKAELRKTLKECRKVLSDTERKTLSELVCKNLLTLLNGLNINSAAQHIAIYQAMKYEVSLRFLLEQNIAPGISVPVVLGPHYMEFLDVSPHLLLAPKEEQPDFLTKPAAQSKIPQDFKKVNATEISALILPGLGFDRNGSRLGYGGGFYDIYTSKHALELKSCPKIALAFDVQILDEIPKGAHDTPVDYLVTPSEIIKTASLR